MKLGKLALIAAGIGFLCILAILAKRDRGARRQSPPLRSFGPTQKSSLVIYFCSGITNQQIDDFREAVLEVPVQPRADRTFPVFVNSYFRLAPSPANGYEGVALNFNKNAEPDQLKNYVTRIASDMRVKALFMDAVPNLIHIDDKSRATSRCAQTE
jgi:hypothetical protein